MHGCGFGSDLRNCHGITTRLHVGLPPQAVQIGRHGLMVRFGANRGLLLPQVPVEHGWDRVTFLEQTCRKAGLPANAWQTGAQLEAFTAEVFGDDRVR